MSDSEWQDSPPTHEQWLNADNDGYWWIRMTVPSDTKDGYTWPEFHLNEIVRILLEKDGTNIRQRGRLTFDRAKERIYCDDLPEHYKNIKWQAVSPPNDKT